LPELTLGAMIDFQTVLTSNRLRLIDFEPKAE